MSENYFGATNTGLQRQNNEDAFFVQPLSRKGFTAACVIDGVGGYDGGEVAAQIAHDAILGGLHKLLNDVPAVLLEAMIHANEKIIAAKKEAARLADMACVATVALIDEKQNQFFYAHVGDTRLYLFRDGSLIKVTKDQSFVGFLEDGGRLSEQEAMNHPKRNEIDKALGFDAMLNKQADYFETGSSPFLPGDVLLLCSDGLTDMINAAAIANVLSASDSLSKKVTLLINAANNAGGRDNITVVLVQHSQKRSLQKPLKPKHSKQSASLEPILEKQPETEDSATANKAQRPIIASAAPKKKNKTIVVISILCVLFASGFFYLLWLKKVPANGDAQTTKLLSTSQQQFVQVLNAATDNTVFLDGALISSPVIISDTVFLNQDTLRINGNGATIAADSTFAGPAFYLGSGCRFLYLENIRFQNFKTCIWAKGQVVQFKSVRFINSDVSVQYGFAAKDSLSGGHISDSLFYLPDGALK